MYSHLRFRNELPDPSAQPKLMSFKKDKDQYVILLSVVTLHQCVARKYTDKDQYVI